TKDGERSQHEAKLVPAQSPAMSRAGHFGCEPDKTGQRDFVRGPKNRSRARGRYDPGVSRRGTLVRIRGSAAVPALVLGPAAARAHSFGRLYNLPVPFWLYGFGAAAALVLSFLIVGVFVAVPEPAAPEGSRDIGQLYWIRVLRRARLVPALQALS